MLTRNGPRRLGRTERPGAGQVARATYPRDAGGKTHQLMRAMEPADAHVHDSRLGLRAVDAQGLLEGDPLASERSLGRLDGSNGSLHREMRARARATGARRTARERWETSPDSQSLVYEVHRGGYRVSRVERASMCPAPRGSGPFRFSDPPNVDRDLPMRHPASRGSGSTRVPRATADSETGPIDESQTESERKSEIGFAHFRTPSAFNPGMRRSKNENFEGGCPSSVSAM